MLATLVSSVACTIRYQRETPSTERLEPLSTVDEVLLRSTVDLHEARAVLFKPRDGSADERIMNLAPLIVLWESPRPERSSPDTIEADDPRTALAESLWPAPRTVYYDVASTVIAGGEYDQILFGWPVGPCTDEVLHGIRGTLGPDGFPLVWEVLDMRNIELAFVSQSLEKAAEVRYGTRHAERWLFAESPKSESPRSLIGGVYADGPVPLGPYVYASESCWTVHCRCSPALVDAFEDSLYYDLRPLQEFRHPIDEDHWPGFARDPLDRRLRWPF